MATGNPTPPALSQQDITRFWWYVDTKPGFGPDGDCWLWTGTKLGHYGRFTTHPPRQTRRDKAHRIAYFLEFGVWPGLALVCHTCDIPLCVLPRHLFLGTNITNRLDCIQKGRQFQGKRASESFRSRPLEAKLGNATLTPNDVQGMRQMRADGALLRECAAYFGVGLSTASRVIRGESWGYIP